MASLLQNALEAVPGVDPRPIQRSQFFSGLNDGPAHTASRIAGLVSESQAQDNAPYYTSNFGQLMPDSGHPLNIGGIPYQGDTLLLEKQQTFDRSKLQERIVHPAGWAAFGESVTRGPGADRRQVHDDQGHVWLDQGQFSERIGHFDAGLLSPQYGHVRGEFGEAI